MKRSLVYFCQWFRAVASDNYYMYANYLFLANNYDMILSLTLEKKKSA